MPEWNDLDFYLKGMIIKNILNIDDIDDIDKEYNWKCLLQMRLVSKSWCKFINRCYPERITKFLQNIKAVEK